MRQIGLLPAGIHRLGNNVLHADATHLFYRSTMAIYVINRFDYSIEKILCASDRSIVSVAFSPHSNKLLAMFGADGGLTLWSIPEEKIVNRWLLPKDPKLLLAWDPANPSYVGIVSSLIGLRVQKWDIQKSVSEAQDVYVFGDKTIVGLMAKWSPAGSSNRNGSSSLNTLAVSCNGGRVYLFDIVGKTFFRLFDKEVVSPMEVVDMQWDKLSAQYLLVAYDALIILWDALTHEKVQVFEKQNVSITSIAWLDWAAGSFISTNDKTGIVKTWNASQRAPLESFRSTVGGIQSVCTIPQSQSVMTACVDGSFNVFDVQHKHLVFKTSTSHSETIFNCDFCPTSAERFATSSYDGTVRVWKLPELTLSQYLQGDDGIIYSICWNVRGALIAGSTINGSVIIWDVSSGKEVARYRHHSKPSFSVSWSHLDERMLVSTSSDATAVVFELSSEAVEEATGQEVTGSNVRKKTTRTPIMMKFVHPAPVFGCAWSPFKVKVFCTGCQDALVRVFDCNIGTVPIYTLSGHSARVFNCVWSPLVQGVLASGADDLSVHVWSTDASSSGESGSLVKPRCVLHGHSGYVRALSWNHEHRDILLSGSWDRTIRVWDTLNAVCLRVVCDHAADVYSLVSHPARPFVLLSCSRDSTVRVWELESIANHLKVVAVLDESLDRIRGNGTEAATPSSVNSPTGKNISNFFNADLDDDAESDKGVKLVAAPLTIASPVNSPQSMPRKQPLETLRISPLPVIASPPPPSKKSMFSFGSSSIAKTNYTPPPLDIKRPSDDKIFAPLPQLIHGRESAKLSVLIRKIDEADDRGDVWQVRLKRAYKYYNIFSMFTGGEGCRDLWEAVIVLISSNISKEGSTPLNTSAMVIRPRSEAAVVLEAEVLARARSEARKAESVKMAKRGALSNKATEKLREAALMNARLGDFERYCSIMAEIGEWNAAIALAPRVSMEYWDSLCARYAEQLAAQADEASVPYFMATGRGADVIDFYLSRNDERNAVIVAKSSESLGRLEYGPKQAGETKEDSRSVDHMQRVTSTVAANQVRAGRCIVAAAQHIAYVGDYDAAINILFGCYEDELAYAVARCFDVEMRPIYIALAYRCARKGHVSVALELMQKVDYDTPLPCSLLVSYSCRTDEQATLFIQAHGLKPLLYWAHLAESSKEEDIAEAVSYHIGARMFSQAASLAVPYLKRHVREPVEADARTGSIVSALKHMQLGDLDGSLKLNILSLLFWYCSFEAALSGSFVIAANMIRILRASASSVFSVADLVMQEFLFRIAGGDVHALNMMKTVSQLEISSMQVQDYVKSIEALLQASASESHEKSNIPEFRQAQSVQSEPWGQHTTSVFRDAQKLSDALSLPSFWSYQKSPKAPAGVGQGSLLPSASIPSASPHSYITLKSIQGACATLEDGITSVSLNEANGWCRVIPFSPLMTGERMMA